MLTAVLLAAALARPALAVPSALGDQTIVLIDSSAPMLATDVPPARLGVARARARNLVNRLGSGQRMTLVELSSAPRVLASSTGDHGPLLAAIDRLAPSPGRANLQAALALGASSAISGRSGRIVVISDGITLPVTVPLTLPLPVDYQQVGVSGENMAITSLIVHAAAGERQATVHVDNTGHQRRHADVSWVVNGHVVDARGVDLDGGTGRDLGFSLPPGADTVEARLGGGDIYAPDDRAFGVARLPRSLHAVLVSPGNVFVEHALRLRGDLDLTVVKPNAYKADPAVDLWVFDAFTPPVPPAAAAIYLAPAAGSFRAGIPVSPGPARAADATDPVLRGVDLRDVHVARARDLNNSTFGGRAVITSGATPLLLVRDTPTPAALFAFDLHDSDLPLRPAFPILVARVTAALLPGTVAPQAQGPGDALLLQAPPGTSADVELRVADPGGRTRSLRPGPGGVATFTDTALPGIYTVTARRGQTVVVSRFAVNAGSPSTSQVAPRSRLDLAASAAASPAGISAATTLDVWPLVALLAMLLLTGEWWLFHRGAPGR